ncbi:MAG: hypothetical protein MUE42_03600 [Opitutaceae bacterium]|jgi:hypothetical protein|nr:hypothetical protein [Opitutaceae bacterium]
MPTTGPAPIAPHKTNTAPAKLAELATTVPHLEGNRAVFDSTWLRLPRPGERCSVSGLSRSGLVELCIGGPRNNWKPPVEARRLKRKGAARGVVLISRASLVAFIEALPSTSQSDVLTEDFE